MVMKKEINCLEKLGIIKKELMGYNSPAILETPEHI